MSIAELHPVAQVATIVMGGLVTIAFFYFFLR
jgi:hypothetical protein